MMNQTELFIDLALIGFFFMGSWFFSGFESGMVSLNRYRLIRSIRNGDKQAMALASVLRDPHHLLATTLVGNNICNVTLSTLSAAIAVAAAINLGFKSSLAQTLATLLVAILLLIIGEFLPKLWFTARPLERCLTLLPIFRFLQMLLTPLASICILLTRLVSGREKEKRSPFVSRENIAFLMRDSEANGEVSPFERMMVSRVLELQFKRAEQIMKPLKAAPRLYVTDDYNHALDRFRKTNRRTLLIFEIKEVKEKPVEYCVGMLHLFDLLRNDTPKTALPKCFQKVHCVAANEPADNLLLKMRENNTKLLLVCDTLTDEHGNALHTTAAVREPIGFITQEDVIKAILDDELLQSSTDRQIANASEAPRAAASA
ncbi:MAG: DUF21 domain-containing protein [Kiritimatiellae bacterium]|nr:DUF21 domain-containing protein [Kiritimatiellia bacterium]